MLKYLYLIISFLIFTSNCSFAANGLTAKPTNLNPALANPALANPALANPALANPVIAVPPLVNPLIARPTLAKIKTAGAASVTAASKTESTSEPENQLPKEWVLNPEDQLQPQFETQGFISDFKDKLLAGVLDRIFKANVEVIENIPDKTPRPQDAQLNTYAHNPPLRDEVPWHLEMFTTELAVYASGLVGALTLKGTPAVIVYWRRQGPKPPAEDKLSPTSNSNSQNNINPNLTQDPNSISNPDENANPNPETNANLNLNLNPNPKALALNISEDIGDEALIKELEPMIKSAIATGKVKDPTDFRWQVNQAGKEFRYLVSGLGTSPTTQWWLSTFRLELIVGASGKLLPAPVLTTGGELRLRFDWVRLKKTQAVRANIVKPSGPYILSGFLDKTRQDLQDFMIGVEKDLDYALAASPATVNFKAFNFRIALGITAKGNLGAIKGNVGAFAHMFFENGVQAPRIYPPAPKAKLLSMEEEADKLGPINVIESNVPQSHLQYANNNLIPYSLDDSAKEAYFKVDRKAFRKGLIKAVKMGQWFAKKGANNESRKWKLFLLRTSFELSISGNIELVSIGGTAFADMSFFNNNF